MEKNSIDIVRLTSLEGKIYIGELKDGQYNGMGTLTSPDGSKYVGEFKNGKFDGQGIFTDGTEKHVGEFKNDLYNGIGYNTYCYESVNEISDETVTCFGQYKDGVLNGPGIETWSNGSRYEGEFKDGRYNGQGILTFPDILKYEGEFRNSEYNGNGTMIYASGYIYKGEFKEGKKNGKGTFSFPDGKKYEGEFKENRYNGNGILIFPDGKKYIGEFLNSRFEGKGFLIFPNGNKYKGQFKNGLRSGKIIHTNAEGKNTIIDFENGKPIRRNAENIKKLPQSTDNQFYLFFDTETTGLPTNWQAPVSDLNNWPRLIQLAYLLYDKDRNEIAAGNFIVKPNDFTISVDSSHIHGISNERATREGVSLLEVLKNFNNVVEKATHIVAHNISFDEKIIGAEFLRNGMTNSIASKNKICTMEKSTNFCAIEGLYGYKWPKLSELHFKLFGEDFIESHNATVDVTVTAKCFWELQNRKII